MKTILAIGVGTLALSAAACGGTDAPNDCSSPASGTACTFAGVRGSVGFNGDLTRTDSWLYFPSDLSFAPDGTAWISDWNNHRVRRVNLDGTMETLIGTDYEGDGSPGETDRLPLGSAAGALGTDVALNHPMDVKFLPDGRAVIAAWHNNKLRVYDPTTQIVKVITGNSYGFGGDGQYAYMGLMNLAKAVAVDPDGSIYAVDQRNYRIRKISNDAQPMISTIAGNGKPGSSGDGGLASDAQMGFNGGSTPVPSGGLALRGRELFVANTEINNIRRINLDTGIIDCVAGCAQNGSSGYSGDGGSAKAAAFNYPLDIEFGPDGRLYVVDRGNNVIRAVDVDADTIETVAGNGKACVIDATCIEPADGGKAKDLQLNQPYGLTFDAKGDMYIADTINSRIVRVGR